MKKAVIITILLFLVACGGTTKETTLITSPFIGGTQGIEANYDQLPNNVFDAGTNPFDIIVKLTNKGEAEIKKENIRVKISGINPADFSTTEQGLNKAPQEDIAANRKDNTGTITAPPAYAEITGLNYKTTLTGTSIQLPIRADICYLYRTKAISKLCIRPDIISPRAGGICEINEAKPHFNSGAPIQIKDFREDARANNKIGFSFKVTNAGTGQVYQRNSACDVDDRTKANKAYIIIDTGITGVECTGLQTTSTGAEGFITLYGNEKIMSCTQQVTTSTAFEQPVNIEVIYDYEQSIQQTITITSTGH